jgi:hypothetical protein
MEHFQYFLGLCLILLISRFRYVFCRQMAQPLSDYLLAVKWCWEQDALFNVTRFSTFQTAAKHNQIHRLYRVILCTSIAFSRAALISVWRQAVAIPRKRTEAVADVTDYAQSMTVVTSWLATSAVNLLTNEPTSWRRVALEKPAVALLVK